MMSPLRHLLLAAPLVICSNAGLAADKSFAIHIPAQPLPAALESLAQQTGIKPFLVNDVAQGKNSQAVNGQYSAREALTKLLAGTGLSYAFSSDDAVIIKAPDNGSNASTLPVVKVMGEAVQDVNDPYNKSYTVTNSSIATKTDTPIMETPLSIQVVPRAVLKDQQAFRIQDAVKNVSGVQQRDNDGYDNFLVRGFDLGRLTFRNGIRIPLVNLDFANIQQVEVLKGPASILFGRIEPGGMINAVTKRPQEEAYYSLEQRFGSYDFYRTEASATGALTDDKSLLYRFDLSYLDKNSYRDFVLNDRIFIAPSLTWRPSDSTEFNLSLDYFDEDRAFDTGQPAIGKNIGQLPINRQFAGQPGLVDNFESHVIDFNWSHKFNDQWQIRNGVVATFLNEDWNEIYSWVLNNDNRTVDRFSWFGGRNTNSQSVYLDLNGKFDTFGIKHNILIGGDYYSLEQAGTATDQFVDSIDVFNPVFPNLDVNALRNGPKGFNSVEESSWYGIYFQDQITLWDKLHILGGGRWDITTSGSGFSGTSLADAQVNFSDIEKNKFSPRVGILYQPWHWLSVYGNYVESIGAGNGGVSRTGTPFEPETAEQYEVGFKTELFDSRITSTVAFFHLTKDNILTPDPINPNFRIATGRARSQGIEVDISGKITDELSLIGTYAWTDTKILQDNNGNQGNRLPLVALNSGSLWLKYDFQQAFLKGFSFGAGVFAADKRFGDSANSFSDGAYARVDMMAAYKFNIGPTRLTTQVNVNNVTDTEYFLLQGNRAQNLPAEPLTVIGSIRLEY
ncbi:MAG: TonB-dependent siderophore receptor [Gammaproteobacteria bacterium HGW-Gammaproteobacteria-3]|nr:MAG: TonB-dependent siderophore receptor [Gammaproteobacteria bacterium HGW-Gammaproteobacteria-3]